MVVCVASTNCFLHAYARLPMSQRRTVGAWLRGNDDFCCTSGARLGDSFCIRRAMLTSESRQPINRTSHLGSLVHLRTCNQSPPRGSIRAWRCSLISRRGRKSHRYQVPQAIVWRRLNCCGDKEDCSASHPSSLSHC